METTRTISQSNRTKAHMDSSAHEFLGSSFPPPPDPLPWGGGESSSTLVAGRNGSMEQTRQKGPPSPWGEGRGEGHSDEGHQKKGCADRRTFLKTIAVVGTGLASVGVVSAQDAISAAPEKKLRLGFD